MGSMLKKIRKSIEHWCNRQHEESTIEVTEVLGRGGWQAVVVIG